MKKTVIAAVRDSRVLDSSCLDSIDTVFLLSTNIIELAQTILDTHQNGKEIFVHADFAEGIGKDKFGMEYIKSLGADGVISTRAGVIKAAREIGLKTVQRIFIVDSQSIETAIDSTRASKPDMIEIMPGVVPKVIAAMKSRTEIPLIAGGLVSTLDEVNSAIQAGAIAVSTSNTDLWK
ncbi:MAG: glycerol-3-phosphate responsive antiterminator [Ruminococcaceae bacterium]|nr:glycerol-3-phosphate responsive antiterminator [Oscillospiraceae bacterium]